MDKWISVSERLPKPNEYVGNVCKYCLIQNEYGDMMVARWDGQGWEQMYQYGEYIEDEVVAWMPLPEPYKRDIKENMMKLIIDIPQEKYEEYKRIGDSGDVLFEAIRNGILLDKMTKGEVIHKVFPNDRFVIGEYGFKDNWLNSPYKGEEE